MIAESRIVDMSKIEIGKDAPNNFNVIIEIPNDAGAIKYEMDKDSGAIMVDRFIGTSLHYPANYGFVPHTLSDDGDPVDVLVLTPVPLVHGCVIECRAVGMLKMEDESGFDAKVLAVPVDGISKMYHDIQDIDDVPEALKAEIAHFFEQYKALEPNKWAKVQGWVDAEAARAEIVSSIEKAKN